MKKVVVFLIATLFISTPFVSYAFSGSEVSITRDGVANISGVRVMQMAGGTLFTRLYWGNSYIRLTVKTNSKTKFLRGTGEATTLQEVAVGDLLDIAGALESGSDSLSLVATTVKNSSVQKQQTTLSGTVTSVDLSTRKFVLNTSNYGLVTVNVGGATQFVKGSRTLDLEHIKVGDYISKTSGDYDLNTKTLVAQSVVTYVNLDIYKPKNFEGSLVEVTGTAVPTGIKVKIGNITYVINITSKTSILRKNRVPAVLNRFVVGDTVRIYGAVREVDDPTIDADIVRNTSI